MPIAAGARVLTPDDIMAGTVPPAGTRVAVWDDEHYYMGGVIAERLADEGCRTCYLTPASEVSTWTRNTMEQHFIQARLLEKDVTIRSFTNLDSVSEGSIATSCVFTGRTEEIEADAVVLVTSREPDDRLARASLRRAPTTGRTLASRRSRPSGTRWRRRAIAHAVYAGRRYAEELDGPAVEGDDVPFKREIAELPAPRLTDHYLRRTAAPRSGTRCCRRGP